MNMIIKGAMALLIVVCASIGQISPVPAQQAARPPADIVATANRPWSGDFDAMLQRRTIRIIVPYSKTLFFIDRGRQLGVVAEFGLALEAWLNKRHARGPLRIHVVFVPTPRDELLSALNTGAGDIIAANLTITPERQALVDFADPWIRNVQEVVVTGPKAPSLVTIDDLAGREIRVRASSSYATHLAALSRNLVERGKPAIQILPADEDLEDEDLLEMVQAGLLPYAVVDDHKAAAWLAVFPSLTLRRDLVVHAGGDIAWAIRKDSPRLRETINAFLSEHGSGTSFGNTIRRRYFGGERATRGALDDDDLTRFNGLWESFRSHGQLHGFDALMLAAQGYQESQLAQSRRSPRGAVGVMQLLPKTAAAPPVNLRNVASSADINILAGARYMRHLMNVYVNDPALDERNRLLMTLAAYNAGPGNLRKFRREAQKMGLDPNRWFGHTEQAAAKIIGRETTQYVSNIYKYYVAYTLIQKLSD
jgi:membrane-bound lytic murein transglycosylase MltF